MKLEKFLVKIAFLVILFSIVVSKWFLIFLASSNLKKLTTRNRITAPSQEDIMKKLNSLNITLCPGTGGNATTKNATIVNNTLVCSDSQGKSMKREVSVIKKAPYHVESCNQVLYISDAERLVDYDDCNSKEPAFFTMSLYMVNYFSQNSSSTLKQSILIDDMSTLPSYVPGTSKKCLSFANAKTTQAGFAICFKNQKDTESLFNSFMSFMKCRMGDNLRVLNLEQLKRVYQLSCAGLPIDPKLIFSNSKEDLIKRINKNVEINPYYNNRIPPGGVERKQPLVKL